VRTLAVQCAGDVAIVACNDQILVSVASLSQPAIELTATRHAQFTSVRTSVVVHVIQTEKLNHPLATTPAGHLPVTVVLQGYVAILSKTRSAVLVVASPTPRESAPTVRSQRKILRRFVFAAMSAALRLEKIRPRTGWHRSGCIWFELARVVQPEGRTVEAVFSIAQVARLTVDGHPVGKWRAAESASGHRTIVLSIPVASLKQRISVLAAGALLGGFQTPLAKAGLKLAAE